MPGYIDNSADQALYESYNEGRAFSGAKASGMWAQWSAVNDDRTCDWCAWADMRIFNTLEEPWEPPVHWGCKCLIAYIKRGEYMPESDWGKGPPPQAFPPGRRGGTGASGDPVLSNAGKVDKNLPNPAVEDIRQAWSNQVSPMIKRRKAYSPGIEAPVEKWRADSMKKWLGDSFDQQRYDDVNNIFSSWAARSSAAKREFVEALTRGTVDDVRAVWAKHKWEGFFNNIENFSLGKLSDAQVSDLLVHWDAWRSVSKEAWIQSGLLDKDGFITLYRGLHAADHADDFVSVVWKKLAAGDGEFSIGTDFVSSWTADQRVAREFANKRLRRKGHVGMVLEKKVHVDDIISSWIDQAELNSMYYESEVMWANWDNTLVPKSWKYKTNLMKVNLW